MKIIFIEAKRKNCPYISPYDDWELWDDVEIDDDVTLEIYTDFMDDIVANYNRNYPDYIFEWFD